MACHASFYPNDMFFLIKTTLGIKFKVLNEVNMPWSSEGHFGLYCFVLAYYSHLIGHYG